jgi:hypothetical protein
MTVVVLAPCPSTLDECDFVGALLDRPEPADVVWIGLSLHHLRSPAKLALMHQNAFGFLCLR